MMLFQDARSVFDMCTSPQGIYDAMKPGKVVVSLDPVPPSSLAQLVDKLRRKGAIFLEAPVIGGASAAERGELITLVGGDRNSYQEILGIIKTFSSRVFYVGDAESALALKLALSVVAASYSEALGEAQLLAKRAGVDPRILAQVLEAAAGEIFGAEPEGGEELGVLLGELRLAAELARDRAAAVPVTAVVESMYAAAAARGLGGAGYRAIAQFLEELNGDGGAKPRGKGF